jgi:prevent-host-death family protein
MRVKLSEDLRPLSDLATQALEVVEQASSTGRPVVLTRDGRGVAVLLSVEAFEELQSSSERLALQQAVDEAEADLAEGNWVEDSDVEQKLIRWTAHLGFAARSGSPESRVTVRAGRLRRAPGEDARVDEVEVAEAVQGAVHGLHELAVGEGAGARGVGEAALTGEG